MEIHSFIFFVCKHLAEMHLSMVCLCLLKSKPNNLAIKRINFVTLLSSIGDRCQANKFSRTEAIREIDEIRERSVARPH